VPDLAPVHSAFSSSGGVFVSLEAPGDSILKAPHFFTDGKQKKSEGDFSPVLSRN
jgi:hypothetical protein